MTTRELILELCEEAGDDITNEDEVIAGWIANHQDDITLANKAAKGNTGALIALREACSLRIF